MWKLKSKETKQLPKTSPRRKVQTDYICFQTTALNRDCRAHRGHQKIHLFVFSGFRKTYQGQETLNFPASKFRKWLDTEQSSHKYLMNK